MLFRRIYYVYSFIFGICSVKKKYYINTYLIYNLFWFLRVFFRFRSLYIFIRLYAVEIFSPFFFIFYRRVVNFSPANKLYWIFLANLSRLFLSRNRIYDLLRISRIIYLFSARHIYRYYRNKIKSNSYDPG